MGAKACAKVKGCKVGIHMKIEGLRSSCRNQGSWESVRELRVLEVCARIKRRVGVKNSRRIRNWCNSYESRASQEWGQELKAQRQGGPYIHG